MSCARREVSADLKMLLSTLDPGRSEPEPWMQQMGGRSTFGSPDSPEN